MKLVDDIFRIKNFLNIVVPILIVTLYLLYQIHFKRNQDIKKIIDYQKRLNLKILRLVMN